MAPYILLRGLAAVGLECHGEGLQHQRLSQDGIPGRPVEGAALVLYPCKKMHVALSGQPAVRVAGNADYLTAVIPDGQHRSLEFGSLTAVRDTNHDIARHQLSAGAVDGFRTMEKIGRCAGGREQGCSVPGDMAGLTDSGDMYPAAPVLGLVNEADGVHHTGCVKMDHVADPTAAGDSFVAAFCTGLCAGLPQEQALAFASHAAAITVSRMGAMPSLPTVAEVQNLLCQRGYTGFDPAELDALK